MFLHVDDVTYLGDYKLRVTFNSGVIKDVDLADELDGEVFEPLRDLRLFRRVTVNADIGTVAWPNGADFAPEFLFEIGEEVKRPAPVAA